MIVAYGYFLIVSNNCMPNLILGCQSSYLLNPLLTCSRSKPNK
jgi:hypothetical protein